MSKKNFIILWVVVVISIVGGVLLFGSGGLKASAEGGWKVRCQDKAASESSAEPSQVCEAFLNLSLKETGQTFIDFSVAPAPDGNAAIGRIILPLGILLPKGAAMQVDEGEVNTFQVRYCDAGGCYAFIGMNDDILKSFRKGENATISFMTLSGKAMSAALPLTGFTKAYKQVF